MPRISTLNQSYPTDCETLLQIRAEFANGVYFLANGYITYSIRNTKAYEHRLVAELAFGEIPPLHHVHHINRNRSDNRVANLEIVLNRAHQQIHLPPTGYVVNCPVCGRPFWITPSKAARAKANYCSGPCKNQATRSVQRPTAEELSQFLQTAPNFRLAGQHYGVSDNAVRAWCKRYGLPVKAADWKTQSAALCDPRRT